MVKFRKEQEELLRYSGGIMAVPSVPGSGKTFMLTHLSIRLHRNLSQGKKILLLTYMNSAVENFHTRLKALDKNTGSIHVKTIHKFSLDLIKENTEFLNISGDFSMIDTKSHNKLVNDLYKTWFLENREKFSVFFNNGVLNPEFQEDFYVNLKICLQRFISVAKNYELSPESIEKKMKCQQDTAVLEIMNSFYLLYQNSLKELNCLDYDDLLYYAYKLLKSNENIRNHCQNLYEYVLEDEAQDSNLLQNKIVGIIASKNLIKVGDSNQNITGTFTLSSPKFFRSFCEKAEIKKELKISGRSSKNILDLANLFAKYASQKHPCLNARKALKTLFITPSEEISSKNTKLQECKIKAYMNPTLEDEFFTCAKRIKNFCEKFPEKSVGILCPRNSHLNALASILSQEKMDFEILSEYDHGSFYAYKKLSDILSFVNKPDDAQIFIKLWEEHLLKEKIPEEFKKSIYRKGVEKIFEGDGLDELYKKCVSRLSLLLDFSLNTKEKVLIYIAQNFEFQEFEQEIIENISLNLKSIFKSNPKWSYADLIYELRQAENSKLNYFNWGSIKKSPSEKQITLSTYHKSKGREWDMVYMTGISEDFFPVFLHKEQFGEKSYLKKEYSILEAGTLRHLSNLLKTRTGNPVEEFKTSRIEESLRIIYVGITRAKEYLVISSNEENQGTFYHSLFSKLIKKTKESPKI